jgi:hypothetical protein
VLRNKLGVLGMLGNYSTTQMQTHQRSCLLWNFFKVGCQWLTPVIPVTWEAEIERIAVQDQPGQKFETPQC